MHIHRVAPGEGILSIAGKYRVLPTKIIHDNELKRERLAEGEEILILTPTRQASVRGGDTLSKFALRYGVRKSAILRANPSLCGEEYLRPGQMLTVKYCEPPLGTASALGILERACPFEKFKTTIPYLTYVSLFECSIGDKGVSTEARLDKYRDYAKDKSKVVLLGVKDKTDGAFLRREDNYESIISALCKTAEEGGYEGVYISTDISKDSTHEYASFLLKLRKHMIGKELTLFTEVMPDSPAEISDLSDGAVLICKRKRPSEYKESSGALKDFAGECECAGAFFMLDCYAEQNENAIDISDAKHLAARNGRKIDFDSENLMSSFKYNKFTMSGKESVEVKIPSLCKIESEFKLASSLGYMGYAIDIESCPISYLCMFNTMFSRADYLMPGVNAGIKEEKM